MYSLILRTVLVFLNIRGIVFDIVASLVVAKRRVRPQLQLTNIVYQKVASLSIPALLRPVTQQFQRFHRTLFLFQFKNFLSCPVPEPDGRGLLSPWRDAVFRLDQPLPLDDRFNVLFEQIFPGETRGDTPIRNFSTRTLFLKSSFREGSFCTPLPAISGFSLLNIFLLCPF